ncbi:MAG TPA: DUF3090 family protein [Acidimicrobiales bacterium]|nr:DUF3090 family protein [Acidimicrobiales bacterium]
MSDESFDLPSVDAVTVGTVGPAGQRVFFLQARSGSTLVTLKVEKQQVAALAVAVRAMLADLPAAEEGASPAPELQEPVEPAWVTGTMGLGPFDEATRRVTLLLQEMVADEEAEPAATAHLGLTVGQLAALAERADAVVAQGRPPCSLCGNPMDPSGHSCPKTNGHLKH